MTGNSLLKETILAAAPLLKLPDADPPIDGVRLLAAIASNESALGRYNIPKFEPAYAPGGHYYGDDSPGGRLVKRLYRQWGAWAACSYSSFQILFVTAVELGFDGTPAELWDDQVAAEYVVRLLNQRILGRGARTVQEIADAYNSGSFRDHIVPERYIRDLTEAYSDPALLDRMEA